MATNPTAALQDGIVQYEAPVRDDSNNEGDPQAAMTATEEFAHQQIHPGAVALFHLCPWTRRIPIFGEATEAFGPKCVMSLGICYVLSKGIANNLIVYARFPMFRERYGIDAQRYQRIASISSMAWSVKAFTAMLCDSFAFLGYTKRWYMALSCILGGMFAVVYGALPAQESSANTAAAFVFLCSFGKANVDILSQGHYSRLIRAAPKAGLALISWIWGFILIGGIVGAAIQGPLSDLKKPEIGVFLSGALQMVNVFFFIFNWYGERTNRVERAVDARMMHAEMIKERQKALEEKGLLDPAKDMHPEDYVSDDDQEREATRKVNPALDDELSPSYGVPAVMARAGLEDFEVPEPGHCLCGLFEVNKEVCRRNWRIGVYSIVMTCGVVAMTCGNILANRVGLLIICCIVSVTCCATSFWALPLVIAKANVFGYLHSVLYLQLPGAVDSFFLASAECLPGGPNFSYTFYNTVGAIIGNVGGLAGVTAFNYIFSKRSYRLTLILTTLIQIIASVFDIVIVQRWNKQVGIPDQAMYIMGDAIVYQVCYMLAWMPTTILIARLCPRGSESVVYALMAGFSNLGQSTSSTIGAILMEFVWPVKSTLPCDFSNVVWLLLVGHMLLPLLNVPLVFLLIPAARICDDIDVDGRVVKIEAKRMAEKAAAEQRTREPAQPGQPERTKGAVDPARSSPREL